MPSKYNVSYNTARRTFDGIVYDSELEMKFMRDYVTPKLQSGEIIKVERQIEYELQPSFRREGKLIRAIKYVADFVVTYADGHEIVIDIKGMADPKALIKRKMFWYLHPEIDFQWIVYAKKFGGWIEYDECNKLRREEKRRKKAEKELKEIQNGN